MAHSPKTTSTEILSASTNIVLEPPGERGQLIGALVRRAVWLLPAASIAVMVAIFIPRFGVRSPSLVDDWFALTYAPAATHQLLHGHYDAAMVDYGGRYRPTYAILSELQWLFGSRNSTLAPTLFGLARLFFFAGTVAVIVVAVLRGSVTRPWLFFAASAVPTMVIATRGVSYNFVRFGVAEPTAFAAVALGLAGMTSVVRASARRAQRIGRRRAATFISGYVMYTFGAYMSESCVATLVVLPALYYWVTREPGYVGSRRANTMLTLSAALILVPIVHVSLEVASGLGGAHSSDATGGVMSKLVHPAGSAVAGLATTADITWLVLVPLTVAISSWRAFRRERQAVLFTGMIFAGLAAAYIANVGTNGNPLSRYYIPLLVAVGIAYVWLLRELHTFPRSIIIAATFLVIFAGRGDRTARSWLALDHAGGQAIVLASAARATGCPVYLVDFPEERRMALARVLARGAVIPVDTCGPRAHSGYVVWWRPGFSTRPPIYPTGCGTRWRVATKASRIQLIQCSVFRPRDSVRTQDTLGITRIVRLIPPTHWVDASALDRLAYITR
jgi:hypothetical protein